VLEAAIQADFADFEDAVIYESAKQAGVDAIVTRNTKDFKKAEMTIYSS
jgi:predicted nucleic acid-binding protein